MPLGEARLAISVSTSGSAARGEKPDPYPPTPTLPFGSVLADLPKSNNAKVGQSFSELPSDLRGVSANASKTKPAKLLAVFVVDTNETELTIPFAN